MSGPGGKGELISTREQTVTSPLLFLGFCYAFSSPSLPPPSPGFFLFRKSY